MKVMKPHIDYVSTKNGNGNTQLVEDVVECLCKKPVFKALETLPISVQTLLENALKNIFELTNSLNSLESRVELNSANLQLLTELLAAHVHGNCGVNTI